MKALRWVALLCVAQVVVIWIVAARSRGLEAENAALRAKPIAPAAAAKDGKEDLLRRENERLKRELARIPELTREREQLQSESAAAEAVWDGHAEELRAAIEAKQREIVRIEEGMKEAARQRAMEKAAARLAEKGPIGPEERARLDGLLREVALGMKAMIEVRQVWAKTEKTIEAREAHKAKMASTWAQLDGAVKQLGADTALFEELPVKGTEVDFSTTAVYRSLVADASGRRATLFLDGRVVWE